MGNMFANLFKFVKLAFSQRGNDFGEDVLHGDVRHKSITDALLVQGNVLGAEGRSTRGREMREMMTRVGSNDMRA